MMQIIDEDVLSLEEAIKKHEYGGSIIGVSPDGVVTILGYHNVPDETAHGCHPVWGFKIFTVYANQSLHDSCSIRMCIKSFLETEHSKLYYFSFLDDFANAVIKNHWRF